MAHIHSGTSQNTVERDFMDFMQRGDDFFKIELLRQAINWYNKALKLNIETDKVKQKITECERMLALENKVVKILCSLAVVLIAAYFIFRG